MNTRHAIAETVLGDLTLVAEDDAVTGVYFAHHWTRPPGKDGKLTGYAGGLKRKKFLLDLEEPAMVKAGRLF
jgi:methylated-DNA-[protein]-cysteine S-methyltransferase